MATTRYWVNKSLVKLTSQDFGFVWEIVPSQCRYMTRHAILAANKVSIGPLVCDISIREPKRKANSTNPNNYQYRE